MTTKRNNSLKKKCFERDNFTCQKCGLNDKTGKILEAHHIILLVNDGKDGLDNLITLCKDCHHYSPNSPAEFEEYMKEECTGTMTIITKTLQKFNLK